MHRESLDSGLDVCQRETSEILPRPVYLPPPCCISVWILRQLGCAGNVHRPLVAENKSFARSRSPNRLDGLSSLRRTHRLHGLNPELLWRIQSSDRDVRSTCNPSWISWDSAHVFPPS